MQAAIDVIDEFVNPDPVLALFKFGERRYVEQFVYEGKLYMNTLEYFVNLEADSQRSDKDEGLNWCMQPNRVKLRMEIDGEFKDIPGISGAILYSQPCDRAANIFCMYALRATQEHPPINPLNLKFGDTFAILKDGDEFLRRVQIAAEQSGHRIDWKLVKYVDRSQHHGPMGPFRKFSRLSYQSEFRIALFPGTGKAFDLTLGDISDIAILGPLSELNERLRFEPTRIRN